MMRGSNRRLTWPWGFRALKANRCTVLCCGRDLWVETAHRNLPCFTLRRENTEQTTSRKTVLKLHELSPGYTEKVTTNPSLRKWNLFLYLCLYFCVVTTILNFSYKVLKVYKLFVICKTVSKHAVIHATSLDRLWLHLSSGTSNSKYVRQSPLFLTTTVNQKRTFALLGSVFAPCPGQIVSIRVLKLSNTNLVVSSHTCLAQERLFLKLPI